MDDSERNALKKLRRMGKRYKYKNRQDPEERNAIRISFGVGPTESPKGDEEDEDYKYKHKATDYK